MRPLQCLQLNERDFDMINPTLTAEMALVVAFFNLAVTVLVLLRVSPSKKAAPPKAGNGAAEETPVKRGRGRPPKNEADKTQPQKPTEEERPLAPWEK